MKKIIFLFLVLCSVSNSQTGWQIQTSSLTRSIVSLYLYNSGKGYALGDNGLIFKTSNFGSNWNNYSQFMNLYDNSAFCLTVVSGDTLVGTQSSQILRSTNGGLNWVIVSYGAIMTTTYFFSAAFGNSRRGFACGYESIPPPPPPPALPPTVNSLVHYTTNGGVNWTRIANFDSDILYDCVMTDSLTGYTVGTNYYLTTVGGVLKTTNGGASFSYVSSGLTPCNSVFFANNNTGWAGGSTGFISKTTSGGIPWSAQVSHTANKINSMYFVNSSTGWLVGNAGTIRKTTNGGVNWNFQYCPVSDNLISIYFIDSARGWIGTNSGKILYTSDAGGVTNISKVSENVPADFELFQNYPNPFNPSTTIKYALKNKSNVQIKLIDNLGREIETIVNGQLNAGLYEVIFNAENYPAGVYFYKIIANDFIKVKRMVLLK